MLDHLRNGDEVVVRKLNRLGRNTRNVLALVDDLERRGRGSKLAQDVHPNEVVPRCHPKG